MASSLKSAEPLGRPAGERLETFVYAALLDRIRFGGWSLGQRLPSELELAAEFGVSRPVVRAALARLRDDGLIVSRRGAGSFISGGEAASDTGFGALQGLDDIRSYFEYRRLIESEAAALAAERVGGGPVDTLRGILNDMEPVISAGGDTVEGDVKLHIAISKLSGNRFLMDSLSMLRPHWFFIGKFVRSPSRTRFRDVKAGMDKEHRDIVAAIEAADAEAARRLMTHHVDASMSRVFHGS